MTAPTSRIGKSFPRKLVVLLAVAALSAFACGSEESGDETTDEGGGATSSVAVVASDFQFDTTTVEVDPGTTIDVTLTNEDDTEHTFSVEELDVEVEVQGGEEGETSFEAPDEDATYEFFCEYHPDQMRGELVVGAGGDAPMGGGGGGQPEKETEKDDDGKKTEKEDDEGIYDY